MSNKTALLTLFLFLNVSFFSVASAQPGSEQKKEGGETLASAKGMAVKLFEIKHRNPESLASALGVLGSGIGQARLSFNGELRTISVRDFPENIAAIEEALKRLDVPEPSPVSLEFHLHLIAASMGNVEKTDFPKAIEAVLPQLQATLKFTSYRYISSTINRVNNGGRLEASGVNASLFPIPAGVTNTPETPAFSQCSFQSMRLTTDAAGKESVQIRNFKFGTSVPIRALGGGLQYKDVGIVTELSLREGEIAVVGTANAGATGEAIIVVVSVKKVK